MELKVGGNGLLDSQVAWLARAQLKGWRTEVVRSLDEFCLGSAVRAHVGGSALFDPVVGVSAQSYRYTGSPSAKER